MGLSRIVKIFAYIFGILIALGLVVGFFAPRIISSSWGQSQILRILDSRIKNGSASLSNLQLSWSGPQKIENFNFLDSAGNSIISVQFGESNATLWEILFHGIDKGDIKISGFNASI